MVMSTIPADVNSYYINTSFDKSAKQRLHDIENIDRGAEGGNPRPA